MEDPLSNGGKSPSPCCSYNCRCQLKRLAEPELDLFQLLIKCRPSRTYKGIKENVEVQSMATSSISTIGRQVLSETGSADGIMTWKKITRPAGEKFTPDNQVGYFNRV